MKLFRIFFVLIRYFYNFVPAKLIKTAFKRTKPSYMSNRKSTPWYVAKRALRVHDVTYTQVAEKLGVSIATVSNIVNNPPNVTRIKQLSEAFNIPFQEFFDMTRESPATEQEHEHE